jgi:catechol 2,3-dioxygenase-like lactoylglutathione lyase family enzyme
MELLTILYVADLALAKELYESVFGWPKTVDVPVYVEFELNSGVRVGLMPQAHTASFLADAGRVPYSDGSARAELYVRVEDAEPYVRKLDELGLRCTSQLARRDWGDRVAYFLDPDGYVLAIADCLPGS